MPLNISPLIVGLTAVLLTTAAAVAQAQPDGTPAPQTSVPSVVGSWHVTDFPAAQVAAVPPAMAAAAAARTELGLSRLDLNARIAHVRRDFEQSSNYRTALIEEKKAWRDVQSARDAALQSLRASPTYRRLAQQRDLVDARLVDLRSDPFASPDLLLTAAQEKLRYARTLSSMESAVLENDEQLQEARQRLYEAGRRLQKLRRDLERQIQNDESLQATRQNIRRQRVDVVAAESFLNGAIAARNIAMDYAYHLHRYRPQPVFVPIYGTYGSHPGAWYGTPRWE